MAHKSKKKHIKHLHQHELASNKPTAKKHAGAKADVEVDRVAKSRSRVVESGGRAGKAAGATPRSGKATEKRGGIVRSIARAATKKIIKRVKSRVKSRVSSLLGRE